ncbi:Ferredoxin-1 [Gossypium australe]|uniref:Ferredoxin-1 n=1 Tax=Gossypium australe TaxID=47621 RepID=A0A5B6V231_9ROSI|nr:Ferredoxin-1 [Gossypium australe]
MRPVSMELVVPCNSCTSLHRKPPLHPQVSSLKRSAFSLKCRRTTTSELQSPVSVTSRDGRLSPSIPTHKVTVHDRFRGVVHEFVVPEDQYILHTAESQNITLPFACRHGCCTSCAVRGYALLCVGFPSSDVEVETQDEDEVYWLQFGRYFARGPIVSPQLLKIL